MDRQGLGEAAAAVVAALARLAPSEVVVVPMPDAGAGLESPAAADDVARRLAADGIVVRSEAVHSATAERVAGYAREVRADLVALASHGRADMSGLVLGPVGHAMAVGVECPVLLLQGGHRDPPAEIGVRAIERLLVAVDDSEDSDAAVAAARLLAAEHGAAVLVVHALGPCGRRVGAARVQRDAEALVETTARKLRGAGGPVATRILPLSESVGAAVASAADDWCADLIVLGSHRVTDLGGLLLGDIAHEVVRRTRRPVLLAERAPLRNGRVQGRQAGRGAEPWPGWRDHSRVDRKSRTVRL